MGEMKVGGGSTEEGGGEADNLEGREEEEEEVRSLEAEEGEGEDRARVWEVGGDEAAGRAGGRRENSEAEAELEGGTAPPVTDGLALGAAAAAGGELNEAPAAKA